MQFAKGVWITVFAVGVLCAGNQASAFSLLGPYASWMDTTNGYKGENDIGGPVPIGEGYRWNVPVVTYGFDSSFIEYGVAAVESAIQILNGLPPASSIALTNYAIYPVRFNYVAQSQRLYDLKTATLTLLLEQMGLGEPVRNMFDLVRWDTVFLTFPGESTWPPGTIPNLVIQREFDPETAQPSDIVNGALWTASVDLLPPHADVTEYPVDPEADLRYAVADLQSRLERGAYSPGLTADDVGGIRYLLRSNNIALETLLPGIVGIGSNANNFVTLAQRPGVEKITFVRHPVNGAGQFVALTNQFTDTYITNGSPMRQELARTIFQPDVLFCSADIGATNYEHTHYVRTGTDNWWNSAAASRNTNGLGPGIIKPEVRVTFKRRGAFLETGDTFPVYPPDEPSWGSFDASTNPPTVHPQSASFSGSDRLTIALWLIQGKLVDSPHFTWQLPVPLGGQATLLTSTNLTDWSQVITVTNRGGAVEWVHDCTVPVRFFRVQPN